MFICGESLVDPNTSNIIVSYTPARNGIECVGMVLWGEVYAEYSVYHNGKYTGGCRTSAAFPTLQLDYKGCPTGLEANDVLLVMGEHGDSAPRLLKATLLINLL